MIPGYGRSPGEGHGNPLQYSCLEHPMDSGAWWVTVRGVVKSQTLACMHTERLCMNIVISIEQSLKDNDITQRHISRKPIEKLK